MRYFILALLISTPAYAQSYNEQGEYNSQVYQQTIQQQQLLLALQQQAQQQQMQQMRQPQLYIPSPAYSQPISAGRACSAADYSNGTC